MKNCASAGVGIGKSSAAFPSSTRAMGSTSMTFPYGCPTKVESKTGVIKKIGAL